MAERWRPCKNIRTLLTLFTTEDGGVAPLCSLLRRSRLNAKACAKVFYPDGGKIHENRARGRSTLITLYDAI